MRKTMLLLLLVVELPHAQLPPQEKTNGFVNCRWWLGLTQEERVEDLSIKGGYLMGLLDATALHASKEEGEEIFSHATIAEAARGIDVLCKAPENAQIPVHVMLRIFTAKFKGEREEQISARLATARRVYNGAPRH
jgi:hypothetical protein